jgi:hypothetical protein
MTQISSNYLGVQSLQSGVTANNGQAGSTGTQSVATEPSLKGHHGHHHAGGASSSSFSSLMNMLGGATDDDVSSDDSSTSTTSTTSTSPASSIADDLASLGASPLTANDVSNAPSSDDPAAILQAMRRYAESQSQNQSPSTPSTINQSI